MMDIYRCSSFKHINFMDLGNCGHSLNSTLIIELNDFDYKVLQYFLVNNLF